MFKRLKKLTFAITAVLFFALISTASAQVGAVFDEFQAKSAGGTDSKARIRLITENQEAWFARWHVIESAKETIDCTYFLMEDDAFGRSFLGLLMKKAREGVKLRFMIDPRGSMGFNRFTGAYDLLQEMVKLENCEVKVFNPIGSQLLGMFSNIRNPIASNHDKILIVDSDWVVIGGRNISKDYMADPKDHSGAWRDTDVLMQSKVIAGQSKIAFDEEFARLNNMDVSEDWIDLKSQKLALEFARRMMQSKILGSSLPPKDKYDENSDAYWMLEELENYPSLTGYAAFRPWEGQRVYPVTVLDKHAFQGDRDDITPNLVKLMDAAEKNIYLQNPYVVLTETARAALQRASDRGVKIIISTNSPASTDSLSTQAFFLLDWKDLLKDMPNVEIHCFKGDTQLHAKVFSFDDEIAVIGTYNMDPLSEQINSEVVVAVKSKAFAMRNRLRIDADIEKSIEYKIEVTRDGEIKVLVGPASHVSQEILDKIKKLQLLGFMRPII